jgi:hypothetical protein
MKTLEDGASAFAVANRLPTGLPSLALVALGLVDRNGNEIASTADAGIIQTKMVTFRENATNTTHTGSVILPPGSWLHDILVLNSVLWTTTGTAVLKVGDTAHDDGFFIGVSVKAFDLVLGEVLRIGDDGCWGTKNGAYLTPAGVRGATASNFGMYYAAGSTIKGTITVATPNAAVGRTHMLVTYSRPPEAIATPSA